MRFSILMNKGEKRKMLTQGLKKAICFALIGWIVFFSLGNAEAFRRVLKSQDMTKEMPVEHRKVALNGSLLDVYINKSEATITVRGLIEVHDEVWNEVNEVKEYFQVRNPDNYDFIYEFKFVYNN